MATLNRLTTSQIAKLRRQAKAEGRIKPKTYCDGGGLNLGIANLGIWASYFFRWERLSVERRMGLGAHDSIGLARARQLAAEARAVVADGKDPIVERERDKAKRTTFDAAAADYIATMTSELTPKQQRTWRNSLARYASPIIGKMLLPDIDIVAVLRVLTRDNFWREKPKTADAVRGRIERILAKAINAGVRPGPNPALWQDNLDTQLPAPSALMPVRHHEALDVDALPDLTRKLVAVDDIAALALRLNLLTTTRTSDVINANWDDIDLGDAASWTVSRTKNGDQLIVPLSAAALSLLRALYAKQIDPKIVFARARGQRLGHQSMLRMLQEKLGYGDATVHGSVRAGFKTFFEERTSHKSAAIESCLSHRVAKNEVDAAYMRGTFFDVRREIMQTWADFLDTPPAAGDQKVAILQKIESGRRSA